MNKKLLFALFIIVVSTLVIAGCGSAPPPPPEPAPLAAEQPQGLVLDGAASHIVAGGDTLAGISASRYGGSNMYFFPLIRLANAAAVPNPDEIEVGTTLAIPALQRNLDNAGANALIRADMLAIADQYERQNKPVAAQTLRNLATRLSR